MNIFIGSGRLTAAPEYSSTEKGGIVARFRIAINRRFKQEGKPEADFFNCIAFGKTAETIEKCRIDKGTKLNIKGEVQNNNYEKDGVKHCSDQIVVDFFEFCESKASADSSTPEAPPFPDGINMGADDDLPF
jgi:single-strand DNA-binding protein